MLTLDIPGVGVMSWRYLVLDINGTLALDGALLPGVAERLTELAVLLEIHLLTADMHGTAARLAAELGVDCQRVAPGGEAEQKRAYVASLGVSETIAIGNGANDVLMLEAAGLGIAVLGREGTSACALVAADVVAPNIADALDLLRYPRRLAATLRH